MAPGGWVRPNSPPRRSPWPGRRKGRTSRSTAMRRCARRSPACRPAASDWSPCWPRTAAALRPTQRKAGHPGRQHRAQPRAAAWPSCAATRPSPPSPTPHPQQLRNEPPGHPATPGRPLLTPPQMALRRGEPIPATSRCRRTAPARGDRTNARISAERRTGKSGHQRPSDRPMKPPHRFVMR